MVLSIAQWCILLCSPLPTTNSLCGAQVEINVVAYLCCIYCKVKTWTRGAKYHTLRSRCACVWIFSGYMVDLEKSNSTILLEYISLLNLKTWLENMSYLIFFWEASVWVLIVFISRTLVPLFLNFCIAHDSFWQQRLFERWQQELEYLFGGWKTYQGYF